MLTTPCANIAEPIQELRGGVCEWLYVWISCCLNMQAMIVMALPCCPILQRSFDAMLQWFCNHCLYWAAHLDSSAAHNASK